MNNGKKICVVYGATPPDPDEAKDNREVARDVAGTLGELGWTADAVGLAGEDLGGINSHFVFNLCDGDEDNRFGFVNFAEEMERLGKAYTGSGPRTLALGKEKTLSWLRGAKAPKSWNRRPDGVRYIAKPRAAHGSLLISEKNIDGGEGFDPREYFFQEYLEGPELTACFLGDRFLGLTVVRTEGIVSRDDKWDAERIKARKPKVWDHDGGSFPEARAAACAAWSQATGGEVGRIPYGRVDVRIGADGGVYVIDINPNAYIGRNGNIFSCWKSLGMGMTELVGAIAEGLK